MPHSISYVLHVLVLILTTGLICFGTFNVESLKMLQQFFVAPSVDMVHTQKNCIAVLQTVETLAKLS